MGSCVLRAWVYGDPLATGDLGNSFECMAHKDTLFGGFVFKHKAVYYIHYFLDIRNKANDVKRFDVFLKLLHLADHWPFQRTLGQLPILSFSTQFFQGENQCHQTSVPNSFPLGSVVLYSAPVVSHHQVGR